MDRLCQEPESEEAREERFAAKRLLDNPVPPVLLTQMLLTPMEEAPEI